MSNTPVPPPAPPSPTVTSPPSPTVTSPPVAPKLNKNKTNSNKARLNKNKKNLNEQRLLNSVTKTTNNTQSSLILGTAMTNTKKGKSFLNRTRNRAKSLVSGVQILASKSGELASMVKGTLGIVTRNEAITNVALTVFTAVSGAAVVAFPPSAIIFAAIKLILEIRQLYKDNEELYKLLTQLEHITGFILIYYPLLPAGNGKITGGSSVSGISIEEKESREKNDELLKEEYINIVAILNSVKVLKKTKMWGFPASSFPLVEKARLLNSLTLLNSFIIMNVLTKIKDVEKKTEELDKLHKIGFTLTAEQEQSAASVTAALSTVSTENVITEVKAIVKTETDAGNINPV